MLYTAVDAREVALDTGISTACFYPQKVLDSLLYLGQNGVRCAEIFFNTFFETEQAYVEELKSICARHGIEIRAIHPFLSPIEPMMFFSEFEGRFEDGLKLYRPFFEAGQALGAKYFILHGDYKSSPRTIEQYCERYLALDEFAQNFGIRVLQENVVRNSSAESASVLKMRELLGRRIGFALDLKQVIRAGQDLGEMIDAMGDSLHHVHISDNTSVRDCVLPGRGKMDFGALIEELTRRGYTGSLMLELYRGNYNDPLDLLESYRWLTDKLNDIQNKGEPL